MFRMCIRIALLRGFYLTINVLFKIKENIQKIHLKINIKYNHEILLYIAWAGLRNEMLLLQAAQASLIHVA